VSKEKVETNQRKALAVIVAVSEAAGSLALVEGPAGRNYRNVLSPGSQERTAEILALISRG